MAKAPTPIPVLNGAPPIVVGSVKNLGVAQGSNRVSTALAIAPNQQTGQAAITDSQQSIVNVVAGGTQVVNVPGISFYFPSISIASGIQARAVNPGQSRSFISYAQGTGLRLGTRAFAWIELFNPTASNALVQVIIGGGVPNNSYDEFIDKRVIVTNNPASNVFIQNGVTFAVSFTTRSAAWANTLANGASQTVTDGYLGKARKAIIFANNDAAAALQVLDSAGAVLGTVIASTSWTAELGGTVKLSNTSGGAVACNIGEVYYN